MCGSVQTPAHRSPAAIPPLFLLALLLHPPAIWIFTRKAGTLEPQTEGVFVGAGSNESDAVSTLRVLALGATEIGASLYACLDVYPSVERQAQIDIMIETLGAWI